MFNIYKGRNQKLCSLGRKIDGCTCSALIFLHASLSWRTAIRTGKKACIVTLIVPYDVWIDA